MKKAVCFSLGFAYLAHVAAGEKEFDLPDSVESRPDKGIVLRLVVPDFKGYLVPNDPLYFWLEEPVRTNEFTWITYAKDEHGLNIILRDNRGTAVKLKQKFEKIGRGFADLKEFGKGKVKKLPNGRVDFDRLRDHKFPSVRRVRADEVAVDDKTTLGDIFEIRSPGEYTLEFSLKVFRRVENPADPLRPRVEIPCLGPVKVPVRVREEDLATARKH